MSPKQEKDDTTAADAAAAPAAPATPADMVFAELRRLFLQQRQHQCQQREERYQLQHQPGLERRDQELLLSTGKRGAAATPAASSVETAAARAAGGARAFSADEAAEAATEGGGGFVENEDEPAGGASAEVGGGEGGVGESKPKQRMPPPVEPRPPPESTRAEPVMPKPNQRTRRGRAGGCTEERLSRRPAARSVVYRRAFEGGAGTGGGSVEIGPPQPKSEGARVGSVKPSRANGPGGGGRRAACRRGSCGGPWSEAWSTGGLLKVGPGPEEALWKLRRRPPVAPQPKSEGARVGSVKPRPRRGRAAGSMEERLPRRPAVRSVLYGRTFEGGAGTGGDSVEIEEEATGGAPAEVGGGEGGVGQAQAEEGAGGGQHGGEAPVEARGQKRGRREGF
ncbi:unnamed protein product [Ectocarpus sp. CCAP 1310/34]|nr:unnamed protein product [Ectocarpus sp. CCAP 1310/34]